MGGVASRQEKALAELPDQERYFGLENFGNTCYSNSVLQALYFCRPFREAVLKHAEKMSVPSDDNLLNCLADLFQTISLQKKKTGVVAPKKFITTLKKNNELFRSFAHQDAHEFLNYLLNECSELLEKEQRERNNASTSSGAPPVPGNGVPGPTTRDTPETPQTWIHDLFQGKLVNETRCMQCETVTSREEAFYDLSLEIDQNSSITSCLRQFRCFESNENLICPLVLVASILFQEKSSTEMLNAEDKFFCDQCQSLQEAEKRMVIRKLPPILCLHLKRFKYIEQLDRLRKLMYRVVFPFELKLRNTVDECPEADDLYHLLAVVVHVGAGPNHGHYVTFVKSHEHWLLLDDENVEPITEQMVQTAFGSTNDSQNAAMEHGYILLYERQPSEPQ